MKGNLVWTKNQSFLRWY